MKEFIKKSLPTFLAVIIAFFVLFFISRWLFQKQAEMIDENLPNVEFYQQQIEVYKDSIIKLKTEREKDSVRTVEVIKYVQVKEKDFKQNVSNLNIEQPKKDTLIQIFDDIKDTLIDVINEKDSLLYKQEQTLENLYLFSKIMSGQIERDAKQIVDLQQQLNKSKKKAQTRGWIIGGITVVGAVAIVTAILIK